MSNGVLWVGGWGEGRGRGVKKKDDGDCVKAAVCVSDHFRRTGSAYLSSSLEERYLWSGTCSSAMREIHQCDRSINTSHNHTHCCSTDLNFHADSFFLFFLFFICESSIKIDDGCDQLRVDSVDNSPKM